jgi:hypothetical protein
MTFAIIVFKNQKRGYNMHHHMSPLEVDLLNKNTMDLLPHPKVRK